MEVLKLGNDKKELKKWIILIIVLILCVWSINNLSTVGNLFNAGLNMLFPFIFGACLAFILNIPMTFFEKKLSKLTIKSKKKKEPNKKLLRGISIIFAILVIVLVFSLIINLIVPELVDVANLLISNIPYYAEEFTEFSKQYIENSSDINNMIQEINIDTEGIKKQVADLLPTLLTSSISIVSGIFNGITSGFISVVFALYVLIDKEKLQLQAKKILYAYLPKDKVEKILDVGRISNNIFKNFFTVQCLEATILGGLCIIGMLILRLPYAVPIGVLIGVTALIPLVGAFIGVIVGSILILAVEPIKVITFVVFILVLQQIEGNLIYPRVVGSSVGLPGMWVLFAVTIGGSFGGIFGMLLGVPVATVIYILLRRGVNKRLAEKKVSIE